MSDDTGKKEQAEQTAIDMALDKSLPDELPQDVHIYFKYEKKFLDVYAESFDFKLALRESGMKAHEVRKNKWLMNELKELQQLAQASHRMKVMSGKHIELMEKFDKHYDKLVTNGKHKEAVQMAGNLARMTDSGMRASGEFRDVERDTGINVNITFNMDHNYDDDNAPPITVKAEEIKE